MKKLFILLILLFITPLVACGGNVKTTDGGSIYSKYDGELERNITLKILENDIARELGYLDELLNAFNKEYKDYGITAVDANMDSFSDLAQDGPYGYGPDIVFNSNDILMKYAGDKHVLPLPIHNYQDVEMYSKKSFDPFTSKLSGKDYTFGIPSYVQVPMLMYRKDLLPSDWQTNYDDNNNDIPDMVETWNGLYEYSKKIKNESNGSKYGYMASLNDPYFQSAYILSYGGYIFGGDEGKDINDIGFSNSDSYLGLQMIKDLSSVMNESCIDDTITKISYTEMAKGNYFAARTTPDVERLYVSELALQYQKDGLTKEEALLKADENLIMTTVPTLPISGNIKDSTSPQKEMNQLGGINGYAISSYTEYPKASWEFVKFATNFQMTKLRHEMLGVAPTRIDVVEDLGESSKIIYDTLNNGEITIMPSVKQLAQVWSPALSLYGDVAKDSFREKDEIKYSSIDSYKQGLVKLDKQIHDAIFTLN